jgi:hypothetical protein
MPTDFNRLAKSIVDLSTGEIEPEEIPTKNEHAQALGKLGGVKGGKARAEALSSRKRKQIAVKAARTRWAREKE